MRWQDRFRQARAEWMLLTFYERFEQVVILILTGLISLVVVFAVWNLALKIFHAVLAPQGFDPTDYSVFQAIFGAIFTVIIALEFKRSLLVVAERKESIVQVRTVILIALLAIVRKLIILDLTSTMPCSFSHLRRQSWRLAPSIGSFEIKIAASNAIGLRKNVSWRDHRPLRVNSSHPRSCSARQLCPREQTKFGNSQDDRHGPKADLTGRARFSAQPNSKRPGAMPAFERPRKRAASMAFR